MKKKVSVQTIHAYANFLMHLAPCGRKLTDQAQKAADAAYVALNALHVAIADSRTVPKVRI